MAKCKNCSLKTNSHEPRGNREGTARAGDKNRQPPRPAGAPPRRPAPAVPRAVVSWL